jgi:TetR/AcrR family transcriptional repressor of nem operon
VQQGMCKFLDSTIDFLLSEEYPGGCFLTNTTTALGNLDEQIQCLTSCATVKLENDFYVFFQRGQQSGEISSDLDIRALARFFVGLVRGISVMARVNKDRKVFEDIVKVGLKSLK